MEKTEVNQNWRGWVVATILDKEGATVNRMKLYCMQWLRLMKRCYLFATEATYRSADVVGVLQSGYWIEIEVKTNIYDLMADFKKFKHREAQRYVPNYFYFCVPQELKEEARKIVDEKGRKEYGLMVCGISQVYVEKRAKRMHNNNIESWVKDSILCRMGSDYLRVIEKTGEVEGVEK